MNKTSLTIVFFLLISQFILAQEFKFQAPLLKLDIEINGEKHQITDGESLVVNGNTIKVKSSDVLTFDYGALIFDYPKHFAFEYEQDYGYEIWTLNGNNFVIMAIEYAMDIELDMFISQMLDQFGELDTNVSDKSMQLGDLILKGKRITVNLVGVELTYDIFKIESGGFKTNFISFQDSKNEDGSDSIEGIKTLELINKTIEVK